MPLDEYRRKRDFGRTPEPSGDIRSPAAKAPADGFGVTTWHGLPQGSRFCVQMHRATRMHFDFRLEHDGVLLSWAIPRGPSLDPAAKRLAVRTEDHPVDYGDFEGVIPSGYGMGTVLLWDIGTFRWTRESADDLPRSIAKGDIKFALAGSRVAGEFALVRIGERGRRYGGSADAAKNWLLIKKKDAAAVAGFDAAGFDASVKTGRSLAEIAREGGGDPRAARRAARASPTPAPQAGATDSAAGDEPQGSTPKRLRPMLATAVDRPFSRPGWIFELKYDGMRAIIEVREGRVVIRGRHDRDETARFPELAGIGSLLRVASAVIDGEIVVMDDAGLPSFERLQSRINLQRDSDVARGAALEPVTFVAFDALEVDGRDLASTELRLRKKTLQDIVIPGGRMLYAEHVEADGEALYGLAVKRGIEGVVAKRAASPYRPGQRSPDWAKIKAWQTQSCVVAGFTAGRGNRREVIGALVLGIRRGRQLVHCGQVGTGFTAAALRDLHRRLAAEAVPSTPLATAPSTAEAVTWVAPRLVCEVRHAGWTSAGILRHPAFLGLRPDLTPDDCTRETTIAPAAVAGTHQSPTTTDQAGDIGAALDQLERMEGEGAWEVGGRRLRLSNLDKILWPRDGITKRMMVAHYVRMAPHLLPYLRNRPLSMQVFPDGISGKSFWRKDKPSHAPEWIDSWTYHGEEKTKTYIVVNEVATLAWVANAGVIDLHPWHSRIDAPDRPDWAVFDLDPFAPATFADVVDIARLVKAALDHYGLHGVLKTSGQTGLQIYVPLRRGPGYKQVRDWVEAVGRAIGRLEPDRITWDWSVARRGGRIRIDYTQNIINKTLAAPYSLRPMDGATVSAPLRWEELDDARLRPDGWTIGTIGERVAAVGDLFAGALDNDQDLPSN